MSGQGATMSCTSCGATVLFAMGPKGNLMPLELDARRIPEGMRRNVAYTREPSGRTRARVLKAGEEKEPEESLTVSHFAVCPKAREHRKRR